MRRDPDFLRLWTGQAISQVGSSITSIGLPLAAVLLLHASPFAMGVLGGVSAGGVLLFGLFAGAWADRVRRKPLLIAADIARAIVVGSVPLAAYFGRLTLTHLCVVAAAGAMLSVLFDVSYEAYVPTLVPDEDLGAANSKLALTQSFSEVVGPGLTGVLVQLLTAPIAILFDAVSYVCSAISLMLIRRPEPPPHPREAEADMKREILEGLRATWRDPVLRALGARAAIGAFFMGGAGSLYFLFALRELGLGAATIGVIVSIGGASNLAGAAIAERVTRRFGTGPTLIGSSLLTGLAFLLVPLAQGPVLLTVAQLGDLAWPVYNITELTLRQRLVPNHLLGRVNSAMHLLFRGIFPLGAFAGGALAQAAGVRTAVAVGAAGFLLSTLTLTGAPLRRLR
jgi:predicted MFS family arabinose efflux permease